MVLCGLQMRDKVCRTSGLLLLLIVGLVRIWSGSR